MGRRLPPPERRREWRGAGCVEGRMGVVGEGRVSVWLCVCVFECLVSLSVCLCARVSVCLCVFVPVCMCVGASVCLCVCVSACLRVCVYLCLCVRVLVCLCVRVSV